LEVLKWIKCWDGANVRFDKNNSTAKSSKINSSSSSSSSSLLKPEKLSHNKLSIRNKSADSLGRPEKRILLLHGAPGLGKTTLAHIAAQTAGYSVIEINAR
jgi:chromosome transmission fidelity protein 18